MYICRLQSTIINLLLRFYDPARGTICIDSTDIRRINIRSLRRYIGYVGQEPVLFRGSIYDNIVSGYASKDWEIDGVTVSDEELRLKVISAAQAAHAHDFITSFPQGYDTVLSNGGGELSGGQKQRIQRKLYSRRLMI
ncbi:ATP-binding cassette domain-containing protein [archaeon]|nr:MAG: ATP-binding cassette domain-containing protein [archaeon]